MMTVMSPKLPHLLRPFRPLKPSNRASRSRTLHSQVNDHGPRDRSSSESRLFESRPLSGGEEGFSMQPLHARDETAPDLALLPGRLDEGPGSRKQKRGGNDSARSFSSSFHSLYSFSSFYARWLLGFRSLEGEKRMSGNSGSEEEGGSGSGSGSEDGEQTRGETQQILHSCDGGKHAWFFLMGASVIEGLMWGFPLTWGVFQTYYETHPPFQDLKSIAMVGTLTTGTSYLGTVIVTPITIKFPKYQRTMVVVGWSICVLCLIASSFATKIWHLIISQGIGYGFGFLIVYMPVLSMLNEWFLEKRGLAYGIMFGSASAFGLGLPFLAQVLLEKFGHAMTLRIYGVGVFVLVGPFLPLLKPRLPSKIMSKEECKFDFSVLKKTTFASASISNVFQGLVFFLPGIYLPTYATALNLTPTHGSLVLALMNLTQVLSQLLTGLLADRHNIHLPMFFSTILSTLACLLLWGFSTSLAYLIVFALLYGLVAGGYSVLYCRFVTALTSHRGTGLWLYALFEFQRGAGNILGGYVSVLLVGDDNAVDLGGYGIGKYGGVVVFVGVSMAVASLGGMGWVFEKRKSIWREGRGSWKRISRGGRRGEVLGGKQQQRQQKKMGDEGVFVSVSLVTELAGAV